MLLMYEDLNILVSSGMQFCEVSYEEDDVIVGNLRLVPVYSQAFCSLKVLDLLSEVLCLCIKVS